MLHSKLANVSASSGQPAKPDVYRTPANLSGEEIANWCDSAAHRRLSPEARVPLTLGHLRVDSARPREESPPSRPPIRDAADAERTP